MDRNDYDSIIARSGALNFPFFSDGDFWPTSVGILPESNGMHNLAWDWVSLVAAVAALPTQGCQETRTASPQAIHPDHQSSCCRPSSPSRILNSAYRAITIIAIVVTHRAVAFIVVVVALASQDDLVALVQLIVTPVSYFLCQQ